MKDKRETLNNGSWIVRRMLTFAMVFALFAMPAMAITTQDLNSGLTPMDLANELLGSDVTITSIEYTGANHVAGLFSDGSEIGIEAGITLNSGNITSIISPNLQDSTSTDNGLPGNVMLDTLIPGYITYDATSLKIEFIQKGDTVTFNYRFLSEKYNDPFAFFVLGNNFALIPGTNVIVSVNNVNGGNPLGTNPQNEAYYINNDISNGDPFFDTGMDGITTTLTMTANVIPSQVNEIIIAIADTEDFILDSAVIIEGGSFSSYDKGSISRIKYNDLDADGVQDEDEPGIENWGIVLTDENNVIRSVFTNVQGEYVFENLVIGTYNVAEVMQNGWVQTQPVEEYILTIIKDGGFSGIDFGNYLEQIELGSIEGIKYNDLNTNGIQDAGEPTIPGWEINLTN